MVGYGMVWYGMVWYGMVWYGMVWYGMVWYGMVWYDLSTAIDRVVHDNILCIQINHVKHIPLLHCQLLGNFLIKIFLTIMFLATYM